MVTPGADGKTGSPIRVPQTTSEFRPQAPRSVFRRRNVHQQSGMDGFHDFRIGSSNASSGVVAPKRINPKFRLGPQLSAMKVRYALGCDRQQTRVVPAGQGSPGVRR